jgi:hypothetical protein
MKNYKGWSQWYNFEDLYAFNGLVDPKSQSSMVTTIDSVKGGLAKWNGFSEKKDSDIYFEEEKKLESRAEIPCGIYLMRITGKLPEKNPPKSGFYDYIGLAGGIMNSTWRSNGFNPRLPDDHFRKLINIPKRGDVINAIKQTYPEVVPTKLEAIAAIKKNNLNKQAVTDKEIKDFIDKECLKQLAKQNFSCYQEYRDSFKGNYSNEALFEEFFKYNQDNLGSTKDVQDFFNSNVRIRFNFLKRKLKDGNKKYIRYENIYKKGGKLGNEVLQGNKDSLKESKIYYDHETKFLQRLNKAEGLSLQAYFSKYGEYPFLNDRDEVSYALEGF